MCLKDFVENCEVVTVGGRNNQRPAHAFEVDTGFYRHSSTVQKGPKNNKTLQCHQGARLCEDTVHTKISQYLFPDTAEFQANITCCEDTQMNGSMEKHAKAALCPLMPHRSVQDSQCTRTVAPYTKKPQEIHHYDKMAKTGGGGVQMFAEAIMEFPQNMQSCGQNSM
jgi:hypothetical protein